MEKKDLNDVQIDAPATDTAGRRQFIKTAAAAAILGTAGMSGSRAEAAEEEAKPLALSTLITDPKMGLNEEEVKLLTPAAQKVSLGELHDFNEHIHKNIREDIAFSESLKGHKLGLTFKDVHSIHEAYIRRTQRLNNGRQVTTYSGGPYGGPGCAAMACCCCGMGLGR